jgi:hypothetical protein
MLKLIYLADRKPGFSFDEFVCRWRKHGALGMAQPLWRYALAYVQAEPVKPAPIAGCNDEYDAIACFVVADEMFEGMTEQDVAGAMAMAEDELETFSTAIANVSLWVREEVLKPGELGGITAYLFFDTAADARRTAEQASEQSGFNRVTINERDDVSLGPEMNTLPYAAIVELSATSIPALTSALSSDGDGLLSSSSLSVVTREAVLWDRLSHE